MQNAGPVTNRRDAPVDKAFSSPERDPRPLAARPAVAPAPIETPPEASALWLRRGDQAVVAGLVLLGLVFLTAHAWQIGSFHGETVDIERLPESALQYRLDVNTATWVEWSQLDGIGETLARRIVEDREANGPFQSLEDLGRVRGLGPKTLEKMSPWLTFKAK
jgi:competence protein ComEA